MASDKDWLEHMDSPTAGGRSALQEAASMLQALGYTQESFGSDATGVKYVLKKDDIKVVLELEAL